MKPRLFGVVVSSHPNHCLRSHLFFRLWLLLQQQFIQMSKEPHAPFLQLQTIQILLLSLTTWNCSLSGSLLVLSCTRAWGLMQLKYKASASTPSTPDRVAEVAHKPILMHLDVFISRENRLGKRHLKISLLGL